jgi:cyclopropane fatty-acyl-phospholipid synthase-like methyltransferase
VNDQLTRKGPGWHRKGVGGLWDEIGELQLTFLKSQGLAPHHFLLDVGCGSLRGGVNFIGYLEKGHYFGIDKDVELLNAGRGIELHNYGLVDKEPVLVQMANFDFASLGRRFDYAIAQSVFTHLPLNNVIRCMINMETALVPGGKFYATFFENPRGKFNLGPLTHPRSDDLLTTTFFDENPYHYDYATFTWICEGTHLKPQYIGEWGHPRHQKMMVFTRS